MTDKDNIMIKEFFKQAAQQQIEDNGFTERVMERVERIDQRSLAPHRLSLLWTWFCTAIGLVLFFVFNGWEMLKASLQMLYASVITSLEVFITTVPTTELHLTPWMILLVVGFVLVYLPYQTARKLSATL